MALTPEAAANLIAAAFERHKADISEIVTRTMAQIQTEAQPNNTTSPNLKADEVGYFNPSLRDDEGAGVVAHGKQSIYTDVWAFTDRLTQLAESVGETKATALAWHSTELTELEKTALHSGSIQLICQTLQKRFKKNHSDALQNIQQSRFTLMDLADGKTLRPFLQKIIRDGKCCGYSTQNQLLAAFEALDPDIQSQLTKPNDQTTLGRFFREVDDPVLELSSTDLRLLWQAKSISYRASYQSIL
ncbi:hypothetical protein GGS21DRAFT_541257 [Xylaria nigripes]|nr:hypothetical protein GGS21DRAFT_541257 [Xylaria nigripes]